MRVQEKREVGLAVLFLGFVPLSLGVFLVARHEGYPVLAVVLMLSGAVLVAAGAIMAAMASTGSRSARDGSRHGEPDDER
jgi:hypothetical protein